MTKSQLLAVCSTAGLSDGPAAHIAWEAVRGDENECDAEKRIAELTLRAAIDNALQHGAGECDVFAGAG